MTHTDIEQSLTFSANPVSTLQVSALQAASPIVLALAECDEELRAEAIELFKQLSSGELDEEQRFATTALLAEILFPSVDEKGTPGLDLDKAEAEERSVNPDARDVLERIDREEVAFAQRLGELMAATGMTQAELAEKVGIGQPAISMMLNRACRPQRKTVVRFAQALGVRPKELWPNFEEGTMDPEDFRSEVEQMLRRIAGACSGERHCRIVRLRNDKRLAVDVFDDGHIRVHVFNVSQVEAAGISGAGAPSVPGLLPTGCVRRRCTNIPTTYPAWYHGPQANRDRDYFGFQWHRPDGLIRADLALIEDCVRWLVGHFPLP